MYANIRGLSTNKTQLNWIISERKPIIVCITETHVTTDFKQHEIDIEGYDTICSYSHSRHTGGAIIYVKKEFKYKKILNQAYENTIWLVGIEFKSQKQTYFLYNLYRSQTISTKDFLLKIDEYLEEFAGKNGKLLVIGDFNIDLSKKTCYSNKLENIIKGHGLYQIVNTFTRVEKDAATIIDLIISNRKDIIHEVHTTPKISDHSIISIELDYSRKNNSEKKTVRNYKNFNTLQFQLDLMDEEWLPDCTNLDLLAERFVDNLTKTLNKHAPEEEILISNKWGSKSWWTNEINEGMKERDRLYKRAIVTRQDVDWTLYQQKRNRVVSMIRQQKRKEYNEKIDEAKDQPKKMWKTLKEIIDGNKKDNQRRGIRFEEEHIMDSQTIAEKFNIFFIESVDNISHNESRNQDYCVVLEKIEKNVNSRLESFRLLEMKDLSKIVKHMRNKQSSVDGINVRILKDAFEAIGHIFLQLINTSLQSGSFPSNWKTSVVIPIEKINNTILCEEFRPINMVPAYEKLLELVVNEQIVEWIETNKILTKYQAGFRKNNSCESALQSILYNWKNALENKLVIGVVFLDFKRAFETIDRQLLILKMEKYGFGPTVINWICEYLTDRTQVTKYDESTSSKRQTTFGVPQGTVMGPNLFVIYINDIVHHVKNSNIQLFADDTLLYVVGENLESIINVLNSELVNLMKWLNNNGLHINTNKTKFMVIQNKYNLIETENQPDIVINNSKIEQVREIKYLGVIIDENLSFSNHAVYITNKISKKVNLLRRIGKDLTPWARSTIYKTIILPHLNFCSTILFLLNNSELDILQKKQNIAMRFILGCDRRTNRKIMLDNLNFLSVRQVIILNTMVFIYKLLHRMLPEHLLDNCTFVRDVHDYNTRSRDNLYIETVSNNYSQNNLFYNGFKQYNDLPGMMKDCTTLEKFKNLCKEYVKMNIPI